MNVAFIDNYDSFVYNLVQYIGELGDRPFVFRNDSNPEDIVKVDPERVIISPGPKRPENAGISAKIIRTLGRKIPTLGVCLGHQAIAYAFGGKILPAKCLMHGKVSEIVHDGTGIFKGLPSPLEATRYHSLVVDEPSLPACLQVTARTGDGYREMMGIKHEEYPIFGVQFHPESILTSRGIQMLENFLGDLS